MSEKLRVTSVEQENLREFGREHSDRLQRYARSLVSGLYMLVRSVRMYEPDNEVFHRPLHTLLDTVNEIVTAENRLELVGVQDSIYLNNMLVKVELSAMDNLRFLMAEMRAKDIGGFTVTRHVTLEELRNFLRLFAAPNPASDQELHAGMLNLSVQRWNELQEKLKASEGMAHLKLDRKRYAMTLYGRAVFFLRRYLDSVRAGKPISTQPAVRIVQDLVDISTEQRSHFLGMTLSRLDPKEYLVFHQVNVSLLSIVFGAELGLTKQQLGALGHIALFHDAGMAVLPEAYAFKRGALTDGERAEIARAPLTSIRNILMEKDLSQAALLRVVTTLEHKVPFGGHAPLGVYSRILAICDAYDALTSRRAFREAYGPEVALILMGSELRHRFDPEMLQVFTTLMAVAPVKVLRRTHQAFSLGGV
ncbi:MAG: HD-GYP domain-containing protein [Myxococcaceae bacterium]